MVEAIFALIVWNNFDGVFMPLTGSNNLRNSDLNLFRVALVNFHLYNVFNNSGVMRVFKDMYLRKFLCIGSLLGVYTLLDGFSSYFDLGDKRTF